MDLKKRWLIATTLLLSFILMLTGCTASTSSKDISVETQTTDFYVNDFAGIFTDEQKDNLMEKAVNFDQETGGIQIVVTTVESLQNNSIEDYAHTMYNQYGIGKNNMGALILLSTSDRKVRIEVGNNMEPYLTDSISGRLMDENSMDHFRSDEFDIGLIKLQDAVINHISNTVPENWNANLKEPEDESVSQEVQESTPALSEENENSTRLPQEVVNNHENSNASQTSKSNLGGIIGTAIAALLALGYAIKKSLSSRKYRDLYEQKESELNKLKRDSSELLTLNRQEAERTLEATKKQYKDTLHDMQLNADDALREKKLEIQLIQDDLSSARKEILKLKEEITASTERFERVKKLHPNIEDEIAEQIQQEFKDEALSIDQRLSDVIKQIPDRNKVSLFREARSLLLNASKGSQQYIKTDGSTIEKLYRDSENLQLEYERQQKEIADKAAAHEVDELMEKISHRYPSGTHSNYTEFSEVNRRYESLSSTQKAFVTGVILSSFKAIFSASKKDYEIYNSAKDAEKKISEIIGHMYSASEDDRDKLKRAMNYYNSIPHEQLKYFDSSLYETLKRLIHQANEDHEEQERRRRRKREEEERRRRQAMQSSYSSHSSFGGHSGGGFGGHGGMSSGGGASRGF